MERKHRGLLYLLFVTLFVWGVAEAALPAPPVTFRVGPTAGGQSFIPQSDVLYAYPGDPGRPFVLSIAVYASRKTAPAVDIQGFAIGMSVSKGTGSPPQLVDYGVQKPSQDGDPQCPSDLSLPCLIRDVGISNIMDTNFHPGTLPYFTDDPAGGPYTAAIDVGFRNGVDYSLPIEADGEVELATFHYGIMHTATPGQTYTITLPAAGVEVTDGTPAGTEDVGQHVIIAGLERFLDGAPAVLNGGTIKIVSKPSVTLNSAALANVDGTAVCLKWTLDPAVNLADPDTVAPYDDRYGIHIFRNGEDMNIVLPLDQTSVELGPEYFDFCDYEEKDEYEIAIRMKADPSCQCTPGAPDCSNCSGKIIKSTNKLAVSRIPHILQGISPDNWPYFMPLTQLTVTTNRAFNIDCGWPFPSYDGPFTTAATVCPGSDPVISAGADGTDLCPDYAPGYTGPGTVPMGTSLWKIEISCEDADPVENGNQPYQFIYDGQGGRADTRYVDPFTVAIWDPTGTATANAFARLPAVTPPSTNDPGTDPDRKRRIPSVYRVALVIVDPDEVPATDAMPSNASYVVARSQSMPLNFGFRRGDSNRDTAVSISDVVNMLNFYGMTANNALPTLDCAGDINDDGSFALADAVFLLNYMFLNGPEPPSPFLSYGNDPYFGMDVSAGLKSGVGVVTIGGVSFQCSHYCPCFNRETAGEGGDSGLGEAPGTEDTQTNEGCCYCRTGDTTSEKCNDYRYEP